MQPAPSHGLQVAAPDCSMKFQSRRTHNSALNSAMATQRAATVYSPGLWTLSVSPSMAPPTARSPLCSPAAMFSASPTSLPVGSVDLHPWIEAACSFEMNADFEITIPPHGKWLNLDALMDIMKAESSDKRTIQALGDKLMLHRLLANLEVPQMPAYLAVNGPAVHKKDVEHLVHAHLSKPGSSDVVVKPTHMSNSSGVAVLHPVNPERAPAMIQSVIVHMERFMCERAGTHESAALRSLQPGFIAQPKYEALVDSEGPLELRVVVLWGKARVAIRWFGRETQEQSDRNVWIVRSPARRGELSNDDGWDIIQRQSGTTSPTGKAAQLCMRHISTVAMIAETVAVAVGAPFLRSDFFVGSDKWGVRLNEVAYGSCIDILHRADDGSGRIVDDAPSIARILLDGMSLCRRRLPAEHFLSKLGAFGQTYADMTVTPMASQQCRNLEVPTEQFPNSHSVKMPIRRVPCARKLRLSECCSPTVGGTTSPSLRTPLRHQGRNSVVPQVPPSGQTSHTDRLGSGGLCDKRLEPSTTEPDHSGACSLMVGAVSSYSNFFAAPPDRVKNSAALRNISGSLTQELSTTECDRRKAGSPSVVGPTQHQVLQRHKREGSAISQTFIETETLRADDVGPCVSHGESPEPRGGVPENAGARLTSVDGPPLLATPPAGLNGHKRDFCTPCIVRARSTSRTGGAGLGGSRGTSLEPCIGDSNHQRSCSPTPSDRAQSLRRVAHDCRLASPLVTRSQARFHTANSYAGLEGSRRPSLEPIARERHHCRFHSPSAARTTLPSVPHIALQCYDPNERSPGRPPLLFEGETSHGKEVLHCGSCGASAEAIANVLDHPGACSPAVSGQTLPGKVALVPNSQKCEVGPPQTMLTRQPPCTASCRPRGKVVEPCISESNHRVPCSPTASELAACSRQVSQVSPLRGLVASKNRSRSFTPSLDNAGPKVACGLSLGSLPTEHECKGAHAPSLDSFALLAPPVAHTSSVGSGILTTTPSGSPRTGLGRLVSPHVLAGSPIPRINRTWFRACRGTFPEARDSGSAEAKLRSRSWTPCPIQFP